MHTCNKCQTKLEEDINWYKSHYSRGRKVCKKCHKIVCAKSSKKYREVNKHTLYNKTKIWKLKNPDKVKEHKKRDYQKRKEYCDLKNKQWLKDNKESRKIHTKTYRVNNKHKINEIAARRRTCKKSKIALSHKKEMGEFYKNCPTGYEVDHIIPLVSEKVCGLHVPWNLQYLTIAENKRKSNKLLQGE